MYFGLSIEGVCPLKANIKIAQPYLLESTMRDFKKAVFYLKVILVVPKPLKAINLIPKLITLYWYELF
jgi:hypothetical protein